MIHTCPPDSWPRGVLKFGLVGHVPLAAQDPYPCSRAIFSKNRYPNVGIFLKKLPFSCDFATKTHQIFKIFRGSPEILKIRPIVGDFFFHEKWDPCLGISCKKPTRNCSTSLYVLTCEYPPGSWHPIPLLYPLRTGCCHLIPCDHSDDSTNDAHQNPQILI